MSFSNPTEEGESIVDSDRLSELTSEILSFRDARHWGNDPKCGSDLHREDESRGRKSSNQAE